MIKTNKLELTWYGKNQVFDVEPRILIENKEMSYRIKDGLKNGLFDNLLIHGDNLLALRALEKDYTNKIKLIYIDPPYNTGSAFDFYDDNLEHSIWLGLMRERLIILQRLLTDDGIIVIQIDDNEQAYLKVLCDEIFGRKNFVNNIVVKMSDASGPKMAHVEKKFPKLKEYLLVYKKENIKINVQTEEKKTWDNEYKNFLDIDRDKLEYILSLENEEEIKKVNSYISEKLIPLKSAYKKYKVPNNNEEEFKFCRDNAWRIARTSNAATIRRYIEEETDLIQNIALMRLKDKTIFVKADFDRKSNQPRVQYVFASDTMNVPLGDLWLNINTSFNSEGGVTLKNGQKPEALIKIIVSAFTNKGDIVLDSFLGSGTTTAVAHKMRRRWIGIEMGEHAYSLAKVRMDRVINGIDNSGITSLVNWQGGGGYNFYELTPSLIKYDEFEQAIINNEYNADMLASAIALHEGYTYNPSLEVFWKQAYSSEKSFLFVTTNHINHEYLDSIYNQLEENEFLLISCKSFDSNIDKKYKNISIKKIPDSILKNCEFDKDNYNLNIINPPTYEEEDDYYE